MLYVDFTNSQKVITWHVGTEIIPVCSDDLDSINSVQADGDELEYILQNITGIPGVKKKR